MKLFYSIFLSLILLFSNSGFYFNTHYCGGEAVLSEFSLGLKALECGESNVASFSCENKMHFILQKKCCENENIKLSIDDDFQTQVFFDFPMIESEKFDFFDLESLIVQVERESFKQNFFCLQKDIPIWNQTFLI